MKKAKPNINTVTLTHCEGAVQRVQAATAANQSVNVQDALVAICFMSYIHVKKKSAPYAALACQLMLRVFPKLMREEGGEKLLLPLDLVVATKSLRAAMRDFPVESQCADWHFHAVQNWNTAARVRSPGTWKDSARYGLDGEVHAVIAYQSKKAERLAAAKVAQAERAKARVQRRQDAHDFLRFRNLARRVALSVRYFVTMRSANPVWARSFDALVGPPAATDFLVFSPQRTSRRGPSEVQEVRFSKETLGFMLEEGMAIAVDADDEGNVVTLDFLPICLNWNHWYERKMVHGPTNRLLEARKCA